MGTPITPKNTGRVTGAPVATAPIKPAVRRPVQPPGMARRAMTPAGAKGPMPMMAEGGKVKAHCAEGGRVAAQKKTKR